MFFQSWLSSTLVHRMGMSDTWRVHMALLFLLLICLLLMADVNNQSGVFIPAKRTFFKSFSVYTSWKQLQGDQFTKQVSYICSFKYTENIIYYNSIFICNFVNCIFTYMHIHTYMACVPHTTTRILYLQILIWIHKYLYFYHYKYLMYINFYLWIMFSREK